MYRRDAESLALEKWLQQLGFPAQLQLEEEIHRLLTPYLRSVWRHLKSTVKPVRSVQTIRKNLLLVKLHRENIKPNEIGIFNIQSCEELTLIKKVSDIQRKIDSKKIERKDVDVEIKCLTCKIAEKKFNIISNRNKVKEMEDKTTLINLKLAQLKKNIEKLDEYHTKTILFEMFQIPESYTKDSSNLSIIATCLLNNKKTLLESQCEEDENLLLSLSKESSVNTLYQAFLLASDLAYKSLKCFTANLKCFEEDGKEALRSSGASSSFSNHLKHLNALSINIQSSIVDNLKKVQKGLDVLNEEMKECVNLMCTMNGIPKDPIIEEFVEKLVYNSKSSSKAVTLQELAKQLETDCLEYDNLKQLVVKIKKEDNELREDILTKVNIINDLYYNIHKYNFKIDEVKTELVQLCNESVSNLNKMQKQQDFESVILDSEVIITDEMNMFLEIPLCALTRRWENMIELIPRELIVELSSNSELRVLLLQSEPKNILSSILEKIWWSCNLVEYS